MTFTLMKIKFQDFRQKMKDDFLTKTANSQKTTVKKKVSFKQKPETAKNANLCNEVIVCGDSLLNNIDGKGLSSKQARVRVKNFPGADTEDMIDFVKPLLKKSPKFLIVHAGTNDITSGCQTKENLETIRNLVTETSPSTELIFSEVLLREDRINSQSLVKEKNKIIGNFCERYNLHFIEHNNISRKMLASKKLHLNGGGISTFAQNLKKFVCGNC
uniref:Scavenger receptor cysteine-rich type 1 M130 n=1 Tax=Clytia hemisphaerica TaxID=252671 RepID=A0A7M5XK91_9CNID